MRLGWDLLDTFKRSSQDDCQEVSRVLSRRGVMKTVKRSWPGLTFRKARQVSGGRILIKVKQDKSYIRRGSTGRRPRHDS